MGPKSRSEADSPPKKSQKNLLNDWLKSAFIKLIAEETGLEIKKHDQASLDEKFFSRMKAKKISFPDDYYQVLASKTIESRQEWQDLVLSLTNSESFFFRDKGHFNLLKSRIIPELTQRNQQTRTIRVCSAGCSTGEEPYSIAILLNELIPDPDQWNLLILGLDVNSLSIEKAKAGIYRSWSFRGVAPEIKERYFKVVNGEYHIDSEIKRMLKFQTSNLVKDSFPHPNSEMRELDLIICRNVFIYFEKTAISKVLENFYLALKPNGYLLTGHTELYAQNLNQFELKLFDEGSIYQCLNSTLPTASKSAKQAPSIEIEDANESLNQVEASEATIAKAHVQNFKNSEHRSKLRYKLNHNYHLKTNHTSLENENKLLRNAELLMQQKAYTLAISQVEKALKINSKNGSAF
ncbi:chemotaxis protein CheR [Nodosilinea sp. LEGE 07088]|uniref:CheR family methyltransferase n=1 Tax=Nodosilinea sp. LEGE 07088 TaxID=2777968 RepID=UPI00187E2AB9|nr:CheR family methyltransferase [Nodosilinea sp. LEGE 07088]MBE9141382.1 chemotaxis protein CheR [Nodosilinea sp. LEGE 07088]